MGMVNISKIVKNWHLDENGYRVSPGVPWCRDGHQIIVGENVKADLSTWIEDGVVLGNNIKLSKNTHIGDYTRIGDNFKLGANSTIGFGCNIRDEVDIGRNSVVEGGVYIDDDVIVESYTSIRANCRLNSFSVLRRGSELNYSSLLGENSVIEKGVVIKRFTVVSDDLIISNHKKQDVFNVQGHSGYQLTCFCDHNGVLKIKAGCKGPCSLDNFKHKTECSPRDRSDTLLALKYVEELAKKKGWKIEEGV